MRILLDECLPKKLKKDIIGHDVQTVPGMGWAGKKNGELLPLAENHFDIFITADQNLQYQQNLKERDITIFVLKAPNSRYETLRLLIPNLLEKINEELGKGIIEVKDESFTAID
jgi:predicted nuclease of predicted toxin-antitoxin system